MDTAADLKSRSQTLNLYVYCISLKFCVLFHHAGASVCGICEPLLTCSTIQILCIGTDRSQQTVQTKIRLLLKKQSDQGLRCLPFHQHLLDALMQCYIKLFYF